MALIAAAMLVIPTISSCGAGRTSCVYEIPNGYTGWVLIEFERADAPPLPRRDGKLIFHIGRDGRLATSSKCEYGWSQDEYIILDGTRVVLKRSGWGKSGQIWGGANGSVQEAGKKPRIYQTFFVGSDVAFKSAAAVEPKP